MRSQNRFRSAINVDATFQQSSYRGIIGNNETHDYYRLRLNQRSSLNVALSGLKADANLTLVNENGKTVRQSNRSGRSNEAIAKTVEPGTYYVQVSRQQGGTRYQLRIGVTDQRPPVSIAPESTPAGSLEEQVVALVNEQRRQSGLQPVRLNAQLNAAAVAHSQDMALNDFFSHTGSDGSNPNERITAAGYRYSLAGENIAAGFAIPATVVQGWMNSPSHRANILHPMMQEMGVGLFLLSNDTGRSNYRYYWTQNFASPMN
jgi:uncharacterized protein YkwD